MLSRNIPKSLLHPSIINTYNRFFPKLLWQLGDYVYIDLHSSVRAGILNIWTNTNKEPTTISAIPPKLSTREIDPTALEANGAPLPLPNPEKLIPLFARHCGNVSLVTVLHSWKMVELAPENPPPEKPLKEVPDTSLKTGSENKTKPRPITIKISAAMSNVLAKIGTRS